MHRCALFFLALSCGNCFAETNCPVEPMLFSIPPSDLRVTPFAAKKSTQENKLAGDTLTLSQQAVASVPERESSTALIFNPKSVALSIPAQQTEQLVTDSFRSEVARAIYQRLDREGFFARAPIRSETGLERFVDNVWSSEEFRIGKTTVSCSLVTAIKRKNPLCLANPIFLNISW